MTLVPTELLVVVLVGLVPVVCCWRIADRAGYPPALGLLAAVPPGLVLFLLILAFSPSWPSSGRVR